MENTNMPGSFPAEAPSKPAEVFRPPAESPQLPDVMQQMQDAQPDAATQHQIEALQSMLRQSGVDKGDMPPLQVTHDVMPKGQAGKGALQALKSLFHYLTFNLFKKK